MKKFLFNNYRLICVCVIFTIGMIVSAVLNITDTPWDSNWYWKGADGVYDTMSLNAFPASLRGCLLPLFFSGIKHFIIMLNNKLHPMIAYKVFTNLIVSIEFAILLPSIFEIKYKLMGMIQIILSYLLFLCFYADFLQYPLSDFYAAFFLTLAIVLYKKSIYANNILYWVGVGFILYIVYNIRIAYAYFCVLVFIIYTIAKLHKQTVIKYILAMIVGALLASVPQMIVNHNLYGTITPFIYTNGYNGTEQRLEMFHLYSGIKVDRYETYIGNREVYDSPAVNFDNKLGIEILNNENMDLENFSIGDLFYLFFNYPVEMISIYSKHFVNVVLPLYNQAYITDLFNNKTLYVFITIIVLQICLFHILCYDFRNNLFKTLLVVALIFPSILQAVGAVEFRFGITLHIIIAYSLFNVVSYKTIIGFIKKNVVLSFALFLLILMLFTIVSTDTMFSLRNATAFIAS